MNRGDCIELVRTDSAKFSASDVTVTFPNTATEQMGASLTAHGLINCSRGRFRLSLRAPAGMKLPSLTTMFVGHDQFGTATGVIDCSLPFRIPAIQPCTEFDTVDEKAILHYDFDRLDFSDDRLQQHAAEQVEVSGLLEDYKLIAPEKQTHTTEHSAFFGETKHWRHDTAEGELIGNWSFGLIQRGEDLNFVLRKTDGEPSQFDEEQRITEAFLTSVAFIHGQHAWPIWMRHRRDGEYVLDWIRPPRRQARSPHRPFNERISFNARAGQITWSFNESLLCAFKFFLTKSALADEIADLLRQTRDASTGREQKKINNIVLCALLESAVNAIYDSRISSNTAINGAFTRERDSLIETVNQQRNACIDIVTAQALDRLKAKFVNISYWHTRDKFQAVAEDLGLKWCDDWEDLYKFWAKWRNRVIHRGSASGTDQDFTIDFKIESRIAGAINLLVLRVMGYKGIAIKSVFEDVFTSV